MDGTSREARINAAFVTVADTLTSNYDMVDLLHTLVEECVGILDLTAGGLMLVDGSGELQLMTSTSEAAGFVELMQLKRRRGAVHRLLSKRHRGLSERHHRLVGLAGVSNRGARAGLQVGPRNTHEAAGKDHRHDEPVRSRRRGGASA